MTVTWRWGHRSTTASVVVALLVVSVLVQLGTAHLSRARAAEQSRCARHAADADRRAALVTGSGRRVVVIGDSWSVGLGLRDLSASWPTRLPGEVHVAGFSGSGFSRTASPCGDRSYAARARRVVADADLVVVEGGLNDHDRSTAAITVGFLRLMRALAGLGQEVVVVGPAPAPARRSAVPRVDHLLAALSGAHGVRYVSAADWELPYLPDRLHLTAEGHARFGELVAEQLG
ncbi:SGNH/GDSL hydrolase family protein [Nocardioides gansuensis]|uniref:SGNH/GDSL hydrolase family protein n=1 Tax=Nocardioides gansuensis TaxID=2138300 RepID=UPI0014027426|nr:SGNH/GDSL hydrolase family protein [Nocardioides gansuensis]